MRFLHGEVPGVVASYGRMRADGFGPVVRAMPPPTRGREKVGPLATRSSPEATTVTATDVGERDPVARVLISQSGMSAKRLRWPWNAT
jgi:hypothetical protein